MDVVLGSGFIASASRFPDRPALEIGGVSLTYRELKLRAAAISQTLMQCDDPAGPPLTAVFAYRSETAFSGVLGALFRAHGYVPLNPTFPASRTSAMLHRSGCRAVVIDGNAEAQLDEVLEPIDRSLTLLLPEREDVRGIAQRWTQHKVLGKADLAAPEAGFAPPTPSEDSVAYVLFTSGSTGVPKGVMVAHRNAAHFLKTMLEQYEFDEHDRFSQMFDFSFDLSVFDLFAAWEVGACVCCPSKLELMLPSRFIEQSGISVWFSVPSVGVLLKQTGALAPGLYPNLKLSLFCGEALTMEVAEAWSRAAPNSRVDNLYGPTELTIACASYRWEPGVSPAACENGIVPIGAPYPGMTALVADGQLNEVAPGEPGELLMTGPQMTLGYLDDPEQTEAAFVTPPGRRETFYRTGDLVRWPPSPNAPLRYLGRRDQQIKIHGFRVELGEIEAVLREAAGVDTAVVVDWPRGPGGAKGVVGFLASDPLDVAGLQEQMKTRLPAYMVPREFRFLAEFPLNSNGKVDRRAILMILEDEAEPPAEAAASA